MNLQAYLSRRRAECEPPMERYLPAPDGPGATVARAMRYAVQAGGKRLRPILALTSCEVCGGTAADVEGALDWDGLVEVMGHPEELVVDGCQEPAAPPWTASIMTDGSTPAFLPKVSASLTARLVMATRI